jgi:RES domain-containing protein
LTRVYRILRKLYSRRPLDGEGAYQFGGRWSGPGTRLAYTAEHLSLAIIEYYIHIDPGDSPPDLVVVSADIPDRVSRTRVVLSRLPSDWRRSPAPPELAAVGDSFVADRKTAVLIVPSVLAPSESNWLINPQHPQFPHIRVHRPEDFHYDARFFAQRGLPGIIRP